MPRRSRSRKPKARKRSGGKSSSRSSAAARDRPLPTTPTNLDKLEKSPNSRAKCRACKRIIAQGTVRVGVESPYQRGEHTIYVHRYYHDSCYPSSQKQQLRLAGGRSPEDQLAFQEKKSVEYQNTLAERRRLRKNLIRLRTLFAERLHRPPSRVFQNATLDDLVVKMPTTQAALLEVYGIAEKRAKTLGGPIIRVILDYQNSLLRRQPPLQQPQQPQQLFAAVTATTAPTAASTSNMGNSPVAVHQLHRHHCPPSAASTRLAEQEQDDDDDCVVEGSLTIDEIVRQRFAHAIANGEVMEL